MARYYAAHVRGADFNRLRQKGFRVLYPALDDYVFLEVVDKNKSLLTQQSELGVAFLKDKKGYVTVSQAEVDRMMEKTAEDMTPGTLIKVIEGVGASLDGEVLEREGNKLRVKLQGYNREYDIWVDRLEVVLDKETGTKEIEDGSN